MELAEQKQDCQKLYAILMLGSGRAGSLPKLSRRRSE